MQSTKKRVAVIYGSRSVEHEVSIITALQVMAALDKHKYEVIPVYITRDGAWYTGPELFTGSPSADIRAHDRLIRSNSVVSTVALPPDPRIGGLVSPPVSGMMTRTKVIPIDVIVPVLHGTHGEDGTLQGLLELADIPYVGAGVVGSAVGMDKIIAKGVLREAGLSVVDYVWFTRRQWEQDPDGIVERITGQLSLPVFVKPANLGSSIGIGKATHQDELREAIAVAATYDHRILVERAVEQAMEINCSVIGNDDPIPSVCEQPVSWQRFLTYDEKYMRAAEAGMKGADRRLPAPIPEELTKQIQHMAVTAFKAINCRGIARVDFLVDQAQNQVYINELNTLPGSYAFYLWSATGIKPAELMDRLIQWAIEAHAEKRRTTYSYISGVLEKAATSPGIKK
jgi:D-alanine-D-alanine ligase